MSGLQTTSAVDKILSEETATIAQAHVSRPKRAERFYRPELDMLRLLAFLLVFLNHMCGSLAGDMRKSGPIQSHIADVAASGTYGVDLFFLLSAYLITTLFIYEYRDKGRIDVPRFYLRRVLRIWPLYFFFIGLTFLLSRLTPIQFPGEALLPFVLFYANWYFFGHAVFSPGSVLWSVSVEEQFYLLCPLLLRSFYKPGILMVCVLMIIVSNASRFWILVNVDSDVWWHLIWFNTFTRLDPIATGMIVAIVLNGAIPAIPVAVRLCLFVAGLLGLVAARSLEVIMPPSILGVLGAYPLADLAVLALLLAFLGSDLCCRPLVYLGRISYGLYVFHVLSLDSVKTVLLRVIGECTFWERGLLGFPITVVLAAASYRWLEEPFLRLKNQLGFDSRASSRSDEVTTSRRTAFSGESTSRGDQGEEHMDV